MSIILNSQVVFTHTFGRRAKKHFPSKKEINNNKFYSAIQRYGGLNYYMKYFGFKPRDKWTEKRVLKELKYLIIKYCRFPKRHEIDNHSYSLRYYIQKFGGTVHFRRLLGQSVVKNVAGYWNNKRIKEELNNIIERIGRIPTYKDFVILNEKALYKAIWKKGGLEKFIRFYYIR